MNFTEAYKAMKLGKKVKLPSWRGYWYWDENKETIMIHCKDDTILDIRETDVVDYTFTNICSDEWIIADEDNTPILGGTATFNFGEAIKYIKRGIRVTRQSWVGTYIFLTKGEYLSDRLFHPPLDFHDVICLATSPIDILTVGWQPNQSDMLAEDWIFVD